MTQRHGEKNRPSSIMSKFVLGAVDSWWFIVLLFSIGFWTIFFTPAVLFLCSSFFLFTRLLFRNRWKEALWVVLTIALLQNITFGVFSGIAARLWGIDTTFSILASSTGKVVSYVMMEGKLIFSLMLGGIICIHDIRRYFQVQRVAVVRGVMYLLGIILMAFALVSVGLEHNGVTSLIGSLRNYLSLLLVVQIGHFYSQLGLSFSEYVSSTTVRWGGWGLASFNIFTQYVLTEQIPLWQHILGVRFLYYVKLLYAYIPLEYVVEGRFFTDFFGNVFMRSGGILLEPVNYGFLQVLVLVLLGYYVLKDGRFLDSTLLILHLILFFTNFGKGAFLLCAIVALTYLLRKWFFRVTRQVAHVWGIVVLLIIVSVFIVAPVISTYTLGHFSPMLEYLRFIIQYPEFLLIGQGMGTSGNYDASSVFRESAAIVTLAEVGIIWFMTYTGVLVLSALQGFQRRDIHPLLASFSVTGLLLFLISGIFQENAFSMQLSLFTVLPSFLILGDKGKKIN